MLIWKKWTLLSIRSTFLTKITKAIYYVISIGKTKVHHADKIIEKLELAHIDLIKIDVEGYEKSVLKGMENTLQKYRPVIIMEYHQTSYQAFNSYDDFMQCFPSNYKVKRIDSNIPWGVIFNKPVYRLNAFTFKDPGYYNLLIIPNEKTIL